MSKKAVSIGKKAKKRIMIIAIAVIIIVFAAIFGGRKIYEHFHSSAVFTYSINDIGATGSGFEDDSSYMPAYITTSQMQAESLSDSETVSRIYVKKGQRVKQGAKLFSYDSTLTQLDLKRKKIELQKLELELAQQKKQLAVIQTYRAGVPVKQSVQTAQPSYTPSKKTDKRSSYGEDGKKSNISLKENNTELEANKQESYPDLKLLEGSGTKDDPFCYEWSDEYQYTDSFIQQAVRGLDNAYVQFYLNGENFNWDDGYVSDDQENITVDDEGIYDPNADEGSIYSASWIMQFRKNSAGQWRYALTTVYTGGLSRKVSDGLPDKEEPAKPEPSKPEPSEPNNKNNNNNSAKPNNNNNNNDNNDDIGEVYTASQIRKLIEEQKKTIASTELDIRSAKLEYRKLEHEISTSVVKSQLDGVVTFIRDPKTASGKVFMKISGSDAKYEVTSSVSEWKLKSVTTGQKVYVTSENTGEEYEGKISKISRYPVSKRENGYFDSSDGATYYPIIIALDSRANLNTDDYFTVSIKQTADDGSEPIYLTNPFIRSDSGGSYVFVAGKDGKLERRNIVTGNSIWGGYYTRIKSGLNKDDRLAFPYGKSVREGVPTKEGTMQDLYGY